MFSSTNEKENGHDGPPGLALCPEAQSKHGRIQADANR